QLHQQKGMISLSPPTICNSADIVFFIRPVQTNMSSKLIFRSHHQLLFIGDWYAFHALRKKYSQQFFCMP
ncbi:hypothetical protein, partial [Enterobacter asburiae]